jgi:hypothetical protein
MKKQELFTASPEMASRLLRYKRTADDDPTLYYNPSGKRDRISKAIEELQGKIIRVDDDNPSFDTVEHLAETIALQCRTPDPAPVYQQTKEQIYVEIVQELTPLVKEELIGKYLCFKKGAYDFAYFKCNRVDVRVGMYNTLEILAGGPGFAIDTTPVSSHFHGHVFPNFKEFLLGVNDLLLTGKYEYMKQWLYVLSEAEYRKQFEKAVAGIAKNIGINQEETEQEEQSHE